LLQALELPELVTHNLGEYEALALRLAAEPKLLATIREKLARNRDTSPAFDTDLFRAHLEAGYLEMWETFQRGEASRNFRVAPRNSVSTELRDACA
jgi:protein O-GlcNAc transferase